MWLRMYSECYSNKMCHLNLGTEFYRNGYSLRNLNLNDFSNFISYKLYQIRIEKNQLDGENPHFKK